MNRALKVFIKNQKKKESQVKSEKIGSAAYKGWRSATEKMIEEQKRRERLRLSPLSIIDLDIINDLAEQVLSED